MKGQRVVTVNSRSAGKVLGKLQSKYRACPRIGGAWMCQSMPPEGGYTCPQKDVHTQ